MIKSKKIILVVIFSIFFISPAYSARFPYPIIFVHGLIGSDLTFEKTMQYLKDEYDLGPIYVFDMLLNADNDLSTSNIVDDVRWEDFIYDGILSNATIKLGKRTFDKVFTKVEDGWDIKRPSQLFAINFQEERIRGASGFNDLFDQSNQAGIFKQGFAIGIMIQEVLEFTGAEKVILIGHSMGGLAIREYLQRTDQKGNHQWWVHPENSQGHHVAKVITIGTPHLGSNAACDPTRYSQKRSGIPDFNGTSEALRDLKYSFDTYPDCNSMSPIGIYLFGGNENCLGSEFNNSDINCDGITNDSIIGLDQDTTDNPNMPLPLDIHYSWIISDVSFGENPQCLNRFGWICSGSTCDNEPPGDGAVLLERQWLYSVNNTPVPDKVSNRFMTHTIHTEEGSDYSVIIIALDEPDDITLAYSIKLDTVITGLINSQPDDEPTDIDIFKIETKYPSLFTLQINCSRETIQDISILDSLENELFFSLTKQFPFHMNFYTSPDIIGNIFIKIKGTPFSNSYKYPYTISISRDILEIKANFEADKFIGNVPFTVNFLDLSKSENTTISSWLWDFGDGTTSHEKYPQHTYLTPGIYKVSLTVSDSNKFLDIKQKYNYIVAQSNQIITSQTKIVAIEYFFDKDPGFENGISLPASPSNNVLIKTTIETSHLSPGLHRLYVRAKDENEIWSILQSKPVYISDKTLAETYSNSPSKISEVEYFFDVPHDFGNGESISFLLNSEISMKETIDVSGLALGLHRLYIRAKDETGTWSVVQSKPLFITQRNEFCNSQLNIPNVKKIEYFFDEQTGFGLGNTFSFISNAEINLTKTIKVSDLDQGLHRLYIRVQDETDTWGIVQSIPIFITQQLLHNSEQLINAKITEMEYFFDHATALSKGNHLSFASDNLVSLNKKIDISKLSPGLHRLYIRAKNNFDQWGIVQSKPIYIKAIDDTLVDITEIEYFFNTDPGYGYGQSIFFTSDNYVHIETNLPVDHLSEGIQCIYVRAKDRNDMWSPIKYSNFTISNGPNISFIPDQTAIETSESHSIHFTVHSGLINNNLTISAWSSNLSLITTQNILIKQIGTSCELTLTPVHDACGTSIITVLADDQFLTSTTAFDINVPCITSIIGDVNGDKKINIMDVIIILQRLINLSF